MKRPPGKIAKAYLGFLVVLIAAMIPFGLFIVAAAWHNREQTQPIAGGVTTTGEVVGCQCNAAGKDDIPVIAFTDDAGTRVVFNAAAESSGTPQTGSTVKVSYNPNQPTDARDISDPGEFLLAGLGGLALAAIGAFGTWKIVLGRRRTNRVSEL